MVGEPMAFAAAFLSFFKSFCVAVEAAICCKQLSIHFPQKVKRNVQRAIVVASPFGLTAVFGRRAPLTVPWQCYLLCWSVYLIALGCIGIYIVEAVVMSSYRGFNRHPPSYLRKLFIAMYGIFLSANMASIIAVLILDELYQISWRWYGTAIICLTLGSSAVHTFVSLYRKLMRNHHELFHKESTSQKEGRGSRQSRQSRAASRESHHPESQEMDQRRRNSSRPPRMIMIVDTRNESQKLSSVIVEKGVSETRAMPGFLSSSVKDGDNFTRTKSLEIRKTEGSILLTEAVLEESSTQMKVSTATRPYIDARTSDLAVVQEKERNAVECQRKEYTPTTDEMKSTKTITPTPQHVTPTHSATHRKTLCSRSRSPESHPHKSKQPHQSMSVVAEKKSKRTTDRLKNISIAGMIITIAGTTAAFFAAIFANLRGGRYSENHNNSLERTTALDELGEIILISLAGYYIYYAWTPLSSKVPA